MPQRNVPARRLAAAIGAVFLAAGSGYGAPAVAAPQPSSVSAQTLVTTAQSTTRTQVTIGRQAKVAGCVARGQLPDPACTPGGAFPNASTAAICQSGYTQRVRNVLPSTKDAVYASYGISAHRTRQYEIDHLIPLELGGNNTRANLWPEITPGYGEKDTVENELHAAVCFGRMSLSVAQQRIARDWRHAGVPVPTAHTPPTRRPSTSRPRQPATSGDASFCTTHRCIANFDNGRGTIVQCADGEYSHAGGLPGVCNRHGGVK